MITAARRKTVSAAPIAEADAAPPLAAEVDSRTRALLRGAIVPTLLRLADGLLGSYTKTDVGQAPAQWAPCRSHDRGIASSRGVDIRLRRAQSTTR